MTYDDMVNAIASKLTIEMRDSGLVLLWAGRVISEVSNIPTEIQTPFTERDAFNLAFTRWLMVPNSTCRERDVLRECKEQLWAQWQKEFV